MLNLTDDIVLQGMSLQRVHCNEHLDSKENPQWQSPASGCYFFALFRAMSIVFRLKIVFPFFIYIFLFYIRFAD